MQTGGALPNKHYTLRERAKRSDDVSKELFNPHNLLELGVEIIWVKWEQMA